jgi:hypothetical protein
MSSLWQSLKEKISPSHPDVCYHIHGFFGCSYYERAVKMGEKLKIERGNVKLIIKGVERRDWRSHLERQQRLFAGNQFQTSPFIYEGCSPDSFKFIGGSSDFSVIVNEKLSQSK